MTAAQKLWETIKVLGLSNDRLAIDAIEAALASRLQEQEGQPAPIAWEATTSAYIKFITQERYSRFAPAVQRWYKPYRCSSCATLAAGSQAVQVPGWMPIETAPKDGSAIWAFNGEQGRMTWTEGDGWSLWVWEDELLSDVDPNPDQPTYWQPLPAAPLQPLAGGEGRHD